MKYEISGPTQLPALLTTGETADFQLSLWEFESGNEHYTLEKGMLSSETNPFVRIVSACSIGHLFNSRRCDCREQLDQSLVKINEAAGLLIYAFPHEGRGVGKRNHVQVYMKQDEGFDTVDSYRELGLPVDKRCYDEAIEIIRAYELASIRLLTNNPEKMRIFEGTGIKVERVSLEVGVDKYNVAQMKAKREKLGHLF